MISAIRIEVFTGWTVEKSGDLFGFWTFSAQSVRQNDDGFEVGFAQ